MVKTSKVPMISCPCISPTFSAGPRATRHSLTKRLRFARDPDWAILLGERILGLDPSTIRDLQLICASLARAL